MVAALRGAALERIPFADLVAQNTVVRDELHAALDRVIATGGYILGEEVERFEAEFAAYCGADYCVGVASGTAALTLAFLAAGVGPGDEVIVPAHTYIASALGVVHAGATPVFCDVDAGAGLLDLESAGEVAGERTAAILAVHLYGQMCDMDAVSAFAQRRGLAVFEDAAQAHGADMGGRRAGTFGTAAAFSFYPSKNLGALGDGGAICTADEQLAERARQLRHLGQRRKGQHVVAGFNERLDGLQAAMLSVKLQHLDGWNEARRMRAAQYRAELPAELRVLEERPGSRCVYHLFPIRIANRDGLAHRLAAGGVQTGIHYSPAVHDQPPFVALHPRAELSEARAWAAEQLSLPMFEGLRDDQVARVAELCACAISR